MRRGLHLAACSLAAAANTAKEGCLGVSVASASLGSSGKNAGLHVIPMAALAALASPSLVYQQETKVDVPGFLIVEALIINRCTALCWQCSFRARRPQPTRSRFSVLPSILERCCPAVLGS